MKLRAKFNLVLLVVFVLGLIATGFVSYTHAVSARLVSGDAASLRSPWPFAGFSATLSRDVR